MDYEKPTVQVSDDAGEMVYATGSGEGHKLPSDLTPGEHQILGDNDCWSMSVVKERDIAHEGKSLFRVYADHSKMMQHLSTATTMTITFTQPINSAVAQEYTTSWNGSVVTVTRERLADSYTSGDHFDFSLEVQSDKPELCQVVDYSIDCSKSVNVQGNGGNE